MATGWIAWGSNLDRGKRFSLHLILPNRFWGPPILYSGSRKLSGRGVALTTHRLLALRLRMCRAVPPRQLCGKLWGGLYLYLYFYGLDDERV